MKWLLSNKFWDWNDRQQEAPWDESDKIITLVCLGILLLVGVVGALTFVFPGSLIVKVTGIFLVSVIGVSISFGMGLGLKGLIEGP